MSQHTEHQDLQNGDEFYLIDIIRFFSRHGKLLALTTLSLSAITTSFLLLQPTSAQYQKQLSLSVRTTRPLVPSVPEMDNSQASAIAVKFLENLRLDQIAVQTKHDPVTKQIDLTLRSTSANALNDAGTKVVREVDKGFAQLMGRSIDSSLSFLETQIQKNRQILNQIKLQSNQLSPTNEFRLGASEIQQAQYIAALSSLEFDKQYLNGAKKNLAEFTAQIISVQILAELDKPPQSRSLVQLVVIAVIASFMVAVFAALVWDQVLRAKNELSQQKPHGRSSV